MHLSSITLSMRMQYRKLFATTLSGVSFGLPAHLRTFDQVASEPSHAKSTCLYIHSFYVLVLRLIIFLSYVKMHFSYVKSKILCRWLDILRNYDHSRILITQKVHPLLPPGQPPPPLPPAPARHPARHPTWPSIPPCTPPPGPPGPATPHAGLPSQTALPASSATTALQALRRAGAVLVLLQRLCVWGASQRATPSNILHTPSNILCTPWPSNILRTPSKFYVPRLIFYVPHLIFYVPPPILYVDLTCGAVDTQSAWPLQPGVVIIVE